MTEFHIFKDVMGEYRWRLVAGNNQIVAASEGYTTKQSAINSANNVKNWASNAPVYDLTQ